MLIVVSGPAKPLPAVVVVTTYFYVDYARTSSGDGSEANPWKHRSDVNWTTVATALSSGPVTIYYSSRATWSNAQYLDIPSNTNTTNNTLTLDGHDKYNLTASGTAVWATETVDSNRARLERGGGSGGTVILNDNANAFIVIRGFHIDDGRYGGIVLGQANPSINIHDITIENNVIDGTTETIGIGGVYLESGCYNIIVRSNTISDSADEAIYLGHYNYDVNSLTGTVVEYNTILNSGLSGEGDIDIKAPNVGAIIRYNTVYSTGTGDVLAGIVVQADAVQVYGNALYNLRAGAAGDGITVNGDQGDANGKTINDVLVYNNLIYGNQGHGISMFANDATGEGSNVIGIKILNNTIVSNTGSGIYVSTSGAQLVTIAELHNNILASNTGPAVNVLAAGGSITAANNNLLYNSSPLATYQGVNKTWGQWQALGFDANGLNVDPQLDGSYVPQVGSPVIGAASVQSEFTTDKVLTVRGAAWDIGALEKP